VAAQRRALNRFFGAAVGETVDYRVAHYLLPSSGEYAGRTGVLSVPFPPTTVECAGDPAPAVVERLLHGLVHNAAHAAQPPVLEPLLEAQLDRPAGQQSYRRFAGSPAAPRQRRMYPGQSDRAGFRRHLHEAIVHALVYEGALRDAAALPVPAAHWNGIAEKSGRVLADPARSWASADLYDAWVLGVSVQLLPLTRRYVAERRRVDGTIVEGAFEAFDAVFARWQPGTAGRVADPVSAA
jgi:hypothetical protein